MRDRSKRGALVMACAILFSLGLMGSMIGPVLPSISRITGSDLATLGSLFTALFLASTIVLPFAGAMTDRIGHKPVLVAGLAGLSLGFVGVALSHFFPLTFASMLFTGLGDGAIIVSINLLVAQVFAKQRVVALNLSNVFYGVGSIVGPALVGVSLAVWQSGLPALWVTATVFFLLLLFVLRLPLPGPVVQPIEARDKGISGLRVLRLHVVWAFGLLLLVYVGTEVATGGWLVTYIDRSTLLGPETAALITSGFWLALTSGRLVATFAGRQLEGPRLLLTTLCGALIGSSLLALSTGDVVVTVLAALIFGLSLGPIYPTTIAVVTAAFPHSAGKVGGAVMTVGSLGGVVLPWLVGLLILQSGPRSGVILLACCSLVMLLLYAAAIFFLGRGSQPIAFTTGQSMAEDR